MLTPGWKYNLNVVKKIKGTKDFLDLADSVKDCQLEPYDNCTTRSFKEKVIQSCMCLPLKMQTKEDEQVNRKIKISYFSLLQIPLCQSDELECVEQIDVIDTECRKSCEGLYVTSYFKSEMKENSFSIFWSKVEADYKKYKGRQEMTFPEDLEGKKVIEMF